MTFFRKKDFYFDYAGATPINKESFKIWEKIEKKYFANGSAIYRSGVDVRNLIEKSRNSIAKMIFAHSDEIIFTGSGTESDALAIFGVVYNFLKQKENINIKPHVITSSIEHPAVLENVKMLEKRGLIEATYLPVLESGTVDLKVFKESINDNTILVSIMYANNEIGTIQPIEEIAKIIRRFRKENKENNFVFPVFHTDACQAMNYLFTENIEKLGVDLLSFNSSKIYGPKGVGVLYKKRNISLDPLYDGGGQEFGLRSGTESVALICALEKALFVTNKIKNKESERLTKIRDYAIEKLLSLSGKIGYEIILNGGRENRLPNNINISIIGISSELLVIELSACEIFVSEKSACKSEDDSKSYVIKAIRKDTKEDNLDSIRITLGRQTKKGDIDFLVKKLKNILEKYKKFKI